MLTKRPTCVHRMLALFPCAKHTALSLSRIGNSTLPKMACIGYPLHLSRAMGKNWYHHTWWWKINNSTYQSDPPCFVPNREIPRQLTTTVCTGRHNEGRCYPQIPAVDQNKSGTNGMDYVMCWLFINGSTDPRSAHRQIGRSGSRWSQHFHSVPSSREPNIPSNA